MDVGDNNGSEPDPPIDEPTAGGVVSGTVVGSPVDSTMGSTLKVSGVSLDDVCDGETDGKDG